MRMVIYAGVEYAVMPVEEADARGLDYVPWREIFNKRNEAHTHVLADDGWVQPIVHIFRRTILVTPIMTVSRTSRTHKLVTDPAKVWVERGRMGGRGYDPPGEGELTAKHMAFAQAYVICGFNPERAFKMIWRRRSGKPLQMRALARKLAADPKVQAYVQVALKAQMEAAGLGEAYLLEKLKELVDNGNPEMLHLALRMNGLEA